ncbi:hypothetical protein E2C01_026993 [Portunus trituberculatus]|uniref:Uncharacterized protein n=1 Tax=Portunus trituberculatus TaxID=210409 RepID=A0A5B7EJZ6_PORTR|nr:hypothetical protein [Portunus trituberculatus]
MQSLSPSVSQPFNLSASHPLSPAASQSFSLSALQSFSLSPLQSCSLSVFQSLTPSVFQPFIVFSSRPRTTTTGYPPRPPSCTVLAAPRGDSLSDGGFLTRRSGEVVDGSGTPKVTMDKK